MFDDTILLLILSINDKNKFSNKMKETFGEYIRRLRKSKELTLTQLAAKLNMDSANLSKIETGKREFDEGRLKLLADQFSLDIKELKDEYFSEFVAKKLYANQCTEKVFQLAEEKIKYMKDRSVK
ncbi:MAG: helix-turn-helix transcriptional regulator [Ignavibacteriae bacterium]|nr:XRE family transcriptional regulator [Ignavibacteriota bacterium]NOG98841.1 helix-turn-helix transcriptional regulator [Ignavibacteriota bacterium]